MRRFEFRDGKSSKFWAIAVDAATVTTSWGRVGTGGQSKSKDYPDGAAAAADVDKQIRGKIAKGYAEVGIAPVVVSASALDPASIPSTVPPITVAVPSASGMGLVLGIASDGDHVVAVGGQGRDLYFSSLDGGASFQPRRSPGTGLRGAFVRGNDVWTCGEWGYVGHSPDRGESWTKLKVDAKACLFGIVADRNGTLWVAGDDGFVAKSRDGRQFEAVKGLRESIGRLTATDNGVMVPTDDGNLYLATDDGFEDLGVRAPAGLMKAIVTPCGSTIVIGQGVMLRAAPGEAFAAVAGDFTVLLCGITAFDDGRVVVVGESGRVWISFDDGVSFQPISQNLSKNYLWCVERVYDTLLVGCHDGVVLRIGTPAEREANPLPPLPVELGDEPDSPTRPEWRAPAPSIGEQKWAPPSFELERRDGIFVTEKFRAMLFPRRGGIDVGTRPLPSLDEAWGAFRRAIWASDRSYIDAKQQRSRIWELVASNDPVDRAVGARLLDPKVRTVSVDEDRQLYMRVTSQYHGIVHEFRNQVDERLTDLLVASNGLVEGLRRAFEPLKELTYLGVGSFGRFRELLAVTDDDTYAAARAAVMAVIEQSNSDVAARREIAAKHWAATFMFPLGPAATEVERELHEAALREVGSYGNSNVHAAGIGAGGIETLERFLAAQKPVGAGHQFFGPFTGRMYLTSVMELEGNAAADVFARLKPNPPWTNETFYNAVWCSLLGHFDSELALDRIFEEYENPPGEGWAVACFTESAKIDADRVLDYLRRRGADGLVDEVTKGLKTAIPPVPVAPPDDLLFGSAARPTHYVPPPATFAALTTPEWAPPPHFDWEDLRASGVLDLQAADDDYLWDELPIAKSSPQAIEAFVSHRETWGLPTPVSLLTVVPQRFHDRLLALGFDFRTWGTSTFLPSVLFRGGASHLAALVAALQDGRVNESALEIAKVVGDVRLVRSIALAFVGKKNKAVATSWLLRFPGHGAAGAVQMLVENSKDKEAPRVLRFVASRGHRALVEHYAASAGIAKSVGDLLDSDPLTSAARKKLRVPDWASAENLPPLRDSRGGSASTDQVAEEVARLAFSNPVEPHPLVPNANERWTSDSLGELAWAVFEAWMAAGGDAKQQWALHAVGFWGDDEAARKLTALAKAWPGQGLGKRAQWAIEALGNIGSDTALANINLLAEKSRFPAFKDAAARQIADVAAGRGLSSDELADRIVPTLDLDDPNALVLDFGPRTFAIVFNESLMPVLRDEEGKLHKNAPKPRKTDDDALAKTEIKRFKSLKKEAKTAASLQITRMERAMQTQRPIASDVFSEYFVAHPWMTHLAQRLVWCLVDDPSVTFRVVEDATFATVDEDSFTLPEGALVTVAHPLYFAQGVADGWGEVFADYELLQPFEQLGRALHHPTETELAGPVLSRFQGRSVRFDQLRGLESRRWRRWMDDSWISGMSWPVSPDVEAVLFFDPGWAPGDFAEDIDEQVLTEVRLHSDDVTFGDISPVAFSEVVLAIERLF